MSVDGQSEAVFKSIWQQMEQAAQLGTEAGADEAEHIALRLITYAELPIAYRIRAHIILACSDGNYLFHAQEAVRLAEMAIEKIGSGKREEDKGRPQQELQSEQEAEQYLLETARGTLRRAEKDTRKLEKLLADKNREDDVTYGGSSDEEVEVNSTTEKHGIEPSHNIEHSHEIEHDTESSTEHNSDSTSELQY